MHIVFLILKIIGIILLTVLGILVLILLLVFFTPLKYKAVGSYHGGLSIRFRGSWLFSLLRFTAEYCPEDGLRWQVAIAWIKRTDTDGFSKTDRSESEKKEAEDEIESKSETALHAMATDNTDVEDVYIDTRSDSNDNRGKRDEPDAERSGNFFSGFGRRLKRIKYTFKNIYDKIEIVKNKKEEVTGFLQDEKNQAAFRKIWEQIRYLLKKLLPKRCSVKGVLGFEDPAVTGEVFGGIAILYAWLGTGIQLIPDFEKEVMELDFLIRGRFRLVYILVAGIKLLMYRDTRKLIMKLRKQFS